MWVRISTNVRIANMHYTFSKTIRQVANGGSWILFSLLKVISILIELAVITLRKDKEVFIILINNFGVSEIYGSV